MVAIEVAIENAIIGHNGSCDSMNPLFQKLISPCFRHSRDVVVVQSSRNVRVAAAHDDRLAGNSKLLRNPLSLAEGLKGGLAEFSVSLLCYYPQTHVSISP